MSHKLTVGQLRAALAGLDDDAPVFVMRADNPDKHLTIHGYTVVTCDSPSFSIDVERVRFDRVPTPDGAEFRLIDTRFEEIDL